MILSRAREPLLQFIINDDDDRQYCNQCHEQNHKSEKAFDSRNDCNNYLYRRRVADEVNITP